MGIPVKLPVFEGPLDLLLHLIEKNKIDIYDIPIVEITDQYMDYIRQMEREDLNIVSEFMVMAATLIDIKCRMLLPKEVNEEGEEEDPREELVQQLWNIRCISICPMSCGTAWRTLPAAFIRRRRFPGMVLEYEEPVDIRELLGDLTLEKLNEIYQSILRRQEDKIDPIRSRFGQIEKEEVSLSDKMEELESYAAEHRHFSFRNLLERQHSRMQVIVTFLAVLELMKTGKITVSQEYLFDDIQIESHITDTNDTGQGEK